MLDINFIKENIDLVKKATKDKGIDLDLDELLKVDQKRRELISEVDELRAQRNIISKERNIEKGREIKEKLAILETQLKEAEDKFYHLMFFVPNIPVNGVPEGDAANNKIIRTVGEPTKFDFTPKDHVELGESLGIIDISRATKVSGARFAYLKNQGAILELALVNFAIDALVKEGFSPVIPPVLIKQEITQGLGYWEAGRHNEYYLITDYEKNIEGIDTPNNLYLVGTAEHALVPLHKDETLREEDLPKKYVAFSSCFRREAGSYGKDTHGILRVHQFDKVEMVAFVSPEDDETIRRKMLAIVEKFMEDLALPYQVVQLASGDLSLPAAETMDIEAWIPSQNKYRETHSISTTTDFQARRLNIKYKTKNGIKFVHILNGTAFAIGRTLIAILENFQREDGSVKVPEVLIPYTNFSEIKLK